METLKKFATFVRESWQEVRHKVTWPGRDEVQGTTLVVVVTSLAFAGFLGVVDFVAFTAITAFFDRLA
jgi:preprotein translocase subunit SecE